MKKLSITMMQETLNKHDGRLTVGLGLGDRSSFYCVLDGAGNVLLEQKVSPTPKANNEISELCVGVVSQWRPEHIHHGSA
jgi:transposase